MHRQAGRHASRGRRGSQAGGQEGQAGRHGQEGRQASRGRRGRKAGKQAGS